MSWMKCRTIVKKIHFKYFIVHEYAATMDAVAGRRLIKYTATLVAVAGRDLLNTQRPWSQLLDADLINTLRPWSLLLIFTLNQQHCDLGRSCWF